MLRKSKFDSGRDYFYVLLLNGEGLAIKRVYSGRKRERR